MEKDTTKKKFGMWLFHFIKKAQNKENHTAMRRCMFLLFTPQFVINLSDLRQSHIDVNERIDDLTRRGKVGSTKWSMELLNRSLIYFAAGDFTKAMGDAVDAHNAILQNSGTRSTNLFISARISAKAIRALADEIEAAEEQIGAYPIPRLRPRTVNEVMRKTRQGHVARLREEALEYEMCAQRISKLPEKHFMRSEYEHRRRMWDDDADREGEAFRPHTGRRKPYHKHSTVGDVFSEEEDSK